MRRIRFQPFPLFLTIVFLVSGFLLPTTTFAQKITNSIVGVSGRDDKQARNPVLTVSTENLSTDNGGATRILVDAYQRNKEYDTYPMQFDIYINRRLFAQQIRSRELPGPIGLTVGHNVAPLPFNFTVVAKVLTPQGLSFATMMNGAVFSTPLTGVLDCTLGFEDSSGITDYVENDVVIEQAGNSSILVQFDGDSIDSSDTVVASLVLTADGTAVSGTITTTFNNEPTTRTTRNVTGTLSQGGAGVSSLSLENPTSILSFDCS